MNKKNLITTLALAASLVLAAGGAIAYFNAHTAPKANHFSIIGGNRDIVMGEIVEENWVEDNARNLVPNSTVAKDPKIHSGVDYETYAFMKLEVPQAFASIELEDDSEYMDALTFTVNDGWTLIGERPSVNGSDRILLYMYGSDAETPTMLAAKGMTTAIFDSVTVPNFCRCRELATTFDVEGFTEQALGVDLATAVRDAKAWATVK